MLSVCMCARFQATPKESHHKAVKHILRYLAHTPTLGLWYPKGSTFDLIGYSDSNYDGELFVCQIYVDDIILAVLTNITVMNLPI